MPTELELIARALVAAVLAGLIGFDREAAQKPAGIRTHMLVGAGAALFTAASILILGESPVGSPGDALRVPAAIVTGIGFLGAGAILRAGPRVTGLTTAAGLWVTAAIGLLIGAGFWAIGVGATALVLLIVNAVGWAATRVKSKDSEG